MFYRVPLLLAVQPEGGFTVTSPTFPELIAEGDSMDEAIENARDAFAGVLEIYQDLGWPIPPST
jgi:antitoxin HicB